MCTYWLSFDNFYPSSGAVAFFYLFIKDVIYSIPQYIELKALKI